MVDMTQTQIPQNGTVAKNVDRQVDESTDTVFGQLQKYTDVQNNPLRQRVASEAKTKAAARGLSNSSISIGNAQGAVIDKSGQFAMKDAEIYSARKTQNQQSETHLEGAVLGNEASNYQTNVTNASNLERQALDNSGALERTQAQITSNEALNAAQLASDLEKQRLADAGALERTSLDNTSREGIAEEERASALERQASELVSLERRADLDAAVRERTALISAEATMQLEQLRTEGQALRDESQAAQTAWDNYQNGIQGIDTNASANSQREQFKRLTEAFQSRMVFTRAIVTASPTGGFEAPGGSITTAAQARATANWGSINQMSNGAEKTEAVKDFMANNPNSKETKQLGKYFTAVAAANKRKAAEESRDTAFKELDERNNDYQIPGGYNTRYPNVSVRGR